MNVVVPLAGKDKNFEDKGVLKHLVKIGSGTLIEKIAYSRPFSYSNAIFIILQEHIDKFDFDKKLKEFFGESIKIIILDEISDGAPQSVLFASDYINNDEDLLIDLPDQYLDLTGLMDFISHNKDKCDGIIPTFESYYWNRGYMTIDNEGCVLKVSEKDKPPISTHSTACTSYFRKGSDFVKYAKQMISKKRVAANGAYLISLVFNEMIEDGEKIITFPVEFIGTLGTIEGVECFEQLDRPLKWK